MKFVFKQDLEKTKTLCFGDVKEDQLFVEMNGCLCQKHNSDSYSTIANESGSLYATYETDVKSTEGIERIIEDLVSIEF